MPLWRQTVRVLRQWLKLTDASPERPVLPNARGAKMTRAGVAQRLRQAFASAAKRDPSLRNIESRRTQFVTPQQCICSSRGWTYP